MNIGKMLLEMLEETINKRDRKPVRSVRMSKAVKDAFIARNKELGSLKKKAQVLMKELQTLKRRAKKEHEKFWALVTVDMELSGDYLRANDETFEIEVLEEDDDEGTDDTEVEDDEDED